MNKRFVSQEQMEREKALSLYISAFEHGDFDTMDTILLQAMSDPALNSMIAGVHDYFLAEDKVILQAEEREKIRALVFDHLPSAIRDIDEEIAIPPVTIQDVIVKLQHDPRINEQTRQEVLHVQKQIQQQIPLPQKLGLKDVYHLFEQLGISVSTRLQKLFREKAIFLSMGHQQGIAQMAATRHQRRVHDQKSAYHTARRLSSDNEEEKL